MVYLNGQTITNHNEATFLIYVMLVVGVVYGIPTLYNFYKLFQKAGEPGWAVIIPIYNTVVYARIAKKPIWIGFLMGLTEITVHGTSRVIPIIEYVLGAVLGLFILTGFIKRYKAKNYQWILLILLPFAASFMINDFVFIKSGKR